MFFRVASILAVALCVLNATAAPLEARQTGDLQCNIDRLQTVANLSKTTKAVQDLMTAGANDPAVAGPAGEAMTGLTQAQNGISTIASSLVSGQTAPADARTQVGDGLTSANKALSSISSTDPNVTSALSTAQGSLAKTATAGKGVVANCN